MCQFQQLYNDEQGYVIRCNRCNHYQILFAGTMLSISADEFEQFLAQVASQAAQNALATQAASPLILATPRQGVHMFLSARDFSRFRRMMELAEAEIKALAMIELFQV